MSTMHGNSAAMAARDWAQTLVPYRRASAARAIFELAVTVLPFIAPSFRHGRCVAPRSVLALVRYGAVRSGAARAPLHDSARLRTRRVPSEQDRQRRIGRAIGVVTMTPYDHWRRSHAIHHATSGNLDRRGIGDIKTLTVREYLSRSWRDRLRYRLYRHPLVMFGVGPIYLFLIENRLPFGFMRKGSMPWLSTMTTNASILLAAALLIWVAGLAPFLSVHLPIITLGATAGVWLFYVQHQFEGTTWEAAREWSQPEAALHGSSFYELPPPLSWFSGNIGVHHVHHLSSGIPFYRLPEVLRDHPALREVGRLNLWDSLACVRLALWDEDRQRMVSFRDARALRTPG